MGINRLNKRRTMKKNINLIIALVIIFLISMTGCQVKLPANPAEAIKKVIEANEKVEGAHFNLSGRVDSSEMEANLIGQGDLARYNDMQAKVNVLTEKTYFPDFTEEFIVCNNKLYIKISFLGDKWYFVNDINNILTQTQINPKDILLAIKACKNTKILPEQKIEGVDCYHLKSDLDFTQYLKILGSAYGTANIEQIFKNTKATIEIWLGDSDLLIRKEKMELNSSAPYMNEVSEIIFSDFGRKVEIKAPRGAAPFPSKYLPKI